MRVVLRKPLGADGRDFRHSLAIGAEYKVLGIEGGMFRLLDDDGEPVLYDPECFEVVESSEPPIWESTFGEDGERYAYPPGWGVPGFFEAWHDGVAVIREVFAAQLAAWYPEMEMPGEPGSRDS